MKKSNESIPIESIKKYKEENKPKKYYARNERLYDKRVKEYK